MATDNPPPQPKETLVGVRISDEDKDTLKALAALRGVSLSDLIREHSINELLKQAARAREPEVTVATAGKHGHAI